MGEREEGFASINTTHRTAILIGLDGEDWKKLEEGRQVDKIAVSDSGASADIIILPPLQTLGVLVDKEL